jgi:hypothetical protein
LCNISAADACLPIPWIAGNGPLLDDTDVTFSLNELVEGTQELARGEKQGHRRIVCSSLEPGIAAQLHRASSTDHENEPPCPREDRNRCLQRVVGVTSSCVSLEVRRNMSGTVTTSATPCFLCECEG